MKTARVDGSITSNNAARISAFTLIELLIVIGMLGALATLVLPSLAATKTDAFDPIVQTEMQDIRMAFQRFYNDVMPNDDQLDLFRKYGLAPLLQNELTGAYDNNSDHANDLVLWDPDRQRGWRGPYLEIEGTREIVTPNDNSNGQNEPRDDETTQPYVKIPVILDPYSATAKDARFYRVLCRRDVDGKWIAKDLALVFVGIEKSDPDSNPDIEFDETLLDSSPNNGANPAHWEDKYTVSDGASDQEILKKLIIDCE